VNTLTISAGRMDELSEDFVGPLIPANIDGKDDGEDREVRASVSTEPELTEDGLAQTDYAQTGLSVSATETVDSKSSIGSLIRKFGSLSSMVRIAGVGAVVVSMCLFLLEGVGAVNDTQRFFTMLMLTGLLSAGGFALAFILKEQYGARSFFGLALLSVPVNFTVLGALFYSVFQFDSVTTAYPTVAHWTTTSLASLGSTALIACVALIPVTLFGMSIMAREGRGWLSAALLLSSSILLLPVRDTSFLAPIVAVLVVALIGLVKKRAEGVVSLKTPSGRFVQSLLFLPPVIMLFRSFWLYNVSSLSAMVIGLTVFAALRYTSQRISPVGVIANLIHLVSAIVAFIIAVVSIDVIASGTEEYVLVLAFCIVLGGLMLDIEQRVKNKILSRVLGIGTSLAIAAVIVLYQLFSSGIVVFAGGLLLSVALVGIGIALKKREKVLIGGITLITIFLLNSSGMIETFMQAGWLGFASIGAIAILLASLLDRYGAMLSLQARSWFKPRIVQNGAE